MSRPKTYHVNNNHSDPFQEECLIKALVHSPESIAEVQKIFPGPEVFQNPALRSIYESLCDLYMSSGDVDEMSLTFHMVKNGKKPDLDKSGISLSFDAYTPSSAELIETAAEGLLSLYKKQIVYTMNIQLNARLESSMSDQELTDFVAQIYDTLTIRGGKSLEKNMKQAMLQMMDNIDKAIKLRGEGRISGIPTGSPKLDKETGGWQDEEVIILAGRPGSMKTSCAIEATVAAAEAGFPVGYFSMEMNADKLCPRIVSMKTGIPYSDMIKGWISPDQRKQIETEAANAWKLPIYFYDDVSIQDVHKMEMVATEWCRKKGVKMIVIDYLQYLQIKGVGASRYEQITAVSMAIKRMQRKLGIPFIVPCQLSREVDKRPFPRPQMDDLRESGQIEQDASTIIGLFYPENYKFKRGGKPLTDEEKPNTPEFGSHDYVLYLMKRRNGGPKRVDRFVDAATSRFSDTDIFSKPTPAPVTEHQVVIQERKFPDVKHNFEEDPQQALPF